MTWPDDRAPETPAVADAAACALAAIHRAGGVEVGAHITSR